MSLRQHRREFFQASAALIAAMHAPWRMVARGQTAAVESPRLLHLQLQTSKLNELRQFYHKQLGLTLSTDTKAGFTLQTGPSALQFTQATAGTEPFYHFAWNVPENQFASAKAWLAKRTPLLIDSNTKKDEVFFASWNAHAVYFRDPAGNIGELIARHTLKNGSAKAFTEQNLLSVSEIGMVTSDSSTMSSDLASKLAWPKTGSEMAFVGDGMGYLIIAPTGRLWLPDRIQNAAPAPVEVTVNQKIASPLRWERWSYSVKGTVGG